MMELDCDVTQALIVWGEIGIGDFRPAKGGPFGRFIVTRFEKNAS